MKRLLAGILAFCLVCMITACSNADGHKKDDITTDVTTTTGTPNSDIDIPETEPQQKTLVGIPGSNATDIRVGLEQAGGIPKGEIKDAAETGFSTKYCSSSMEIAGTGVTLAYNLSFDDNKAITTAVFSIISSQSARNEDLLGFAQSYFSYCASMPYDTADTSKAQEWVSQNLSDYANSPQTTIGNAKFSIAATVNAETGDIVDLTLTITPTNFDEQMKVIMDEKE